ncbi:MAG: O-antigen ligase family protein [bacterium]|nr:O-antigen ligase family protein [bacterium]
MANNVKKILFSIIGTLLFVLPLLQWQGFLYRSVFTKSIFFLIMVELAFVVWLAFVPSVFRALRKNHMVWGVFILYGVFFATSLLGVDFYHSVWSDYERMTGLWMWGHIVLFFLMLVSLMIVVPVRLMLARIVSASATLVSLIGVGEAFMAGGGTRIESTLANASFLASYLLLASFITLWLAFHEKLSKKESRAWFVSYGLIVIAIVLTGTRGTLAALLGGYFLLGSLYLFFGIGTNKKIKKIVMIGLMTLILLSVSAVIFRDQLASSQIDIFKRIGDISLTNRTLVARFLTWGVAWDGIKDNLLTGWGLENFNILFNIHYDPGLFQQEPWFDRAHNIIFDIGTTSGLLGLASYFGLLVLAVIHLLRSWRKNHISFWTFSILTTALAAHVIQDMLLFDLLSSLAILFFLLALITTETRTGDDNITVAKKPLVYIVIAVLIAAPTFYLGSWKPLKENYYGNLSYNAFAIGDDKSGYEFVNKALAYDTYGNIDVRRAVAEYTFEFLKQGGRRSQEDLKVLIDYGIELMDKNIAESPNDVKWYMYQGELYNLGAVLLSDEPLVGYAKNAEEQFLKSLALSPGRPQVYAEIAQARKIQNNISGMWDMIDRMKELIPDSINIYYNEVVYAIDVGDPEREDSALKVIHERDSDIDYVSIRDAYFRNGRFSRAISLQLEYIESKKDYYDPAQLSALYQTLAALYKEVGDTVRATEAARKVGELNPELLPQVEAFLRTL